MDLPSRTSAMPFAPQGSLSPEANRPGTGYNSKMGPGQMPYHSPKGITEVRTRLWLGTPPTGLLQWRPLQRRRVCASRPRLWPPEAVQLPRRARRPSVAYGVLSPISTQHLPTQGGSTPQSAVYVPQQNFPPFSLPPSEFVPSSAPTASRDIVSPYVPTTSGGEYSEPGHAQGPAR